MKLATQIHKMKIRELQELILSQQKVFDNFPEVNDMSHLLEVRFKLLLNICSLRDKLEILISK